MTEALIIALAQLDPTVGDVVGNVQMLREARGHAAEMDAALLVASELVISGYPPEDLVMRPSFQETVEREVAALANETEDGGPAMLIGAPWLVDNALYNASLLLDAGEITAVRLKHVLPNYGVFDEKRVFTPGPLPGPINFRGMRLGVMVCEDMWTDEVAECLEESGAEILVVINGSPFDVAKGGQRAGSAQARVTETGLPLVYINQVGGQDELVFDGASFVVDQSGSIVAPSSSNSGRARKVTLTSEPQPCAWHGAWHAAA